MPPAHHPERDGGVLVPVAPPAPRWAMSIVDHAPGPTPKRRVAGRRPSPALRWTAAGIVAFPQAWIVVALAFGPIGLTAVGALLAIVALGLAVLVGRGHRWAYAAVAVLGLAAVVAGSIDQGMLSVAFWVFGGLDVVIAAGLLLASRERLPEPQAMTA